MKVMVWLVVVVPLVACGDDGARPPGATQCGDAGTTADANTDPYVTFEIPVSVNRDLDVLFVIGDSPNMGPFQSSLTGAFQSFIDELNASSGGLPNVHLGVVTPDLGTTAHDDPSPGPATGAGPGACSGSGKAGALQTQGSSRVSGMFISDTRNTDGTRSKNYTGTLAAAFGDLAIVGTSGCEFQQPLEAARKALTNNQTNSGFRRPSAALGVVFVTDHDDCSLSHISFFDSDPALGSLTQFRCARLGVTCDQGGATPDEMAKPGVKCGCHASLEETYETSVAAYESFFTGLTSDPSKTYVASLAGASSVVSVDEKPSLVQACAAGALPAVRLDDFTSRFSIHGTQNACATSLGPGLVAIAHQLREVMGDYCLIASQIASLPMPLDCTVTETSAGTMTTLPKCNAGVSSTNKPCWDLMTESPPLPCPGVTQQFLIQRSTAPPTDAIISVRCRR